MNKPPKQMPEYRMTLARGTVRIKYPDTIGKQSKLGGKPNWIQDDGDNDIPICHKCKKRMSFILQLDSIDYDKNNPQYMFDDTGMLYLFFCFNCSITGSLCQTY